MATLRTSETKADSRFICDCEERMRPACAGEQFYGEHEGKRYCVLHLPTKEKSVAFNSAFQRKVENEDFNFQGVWFPDDVDFSVWTPNDPEFLGLAFSAADFSHATFSGRANFDWTAFIDPVDFSFARFNGAVDFKHTCFDALANFCGATFGDHVEFAGPEQRPAFTDRLILQFTKIEKPYQFSFHTLTLRPSWFVNVDARKFEFTNVDWHWRGVNEEIASLHGLVSSPHRMLAIACRHLAVNAEENHRYEEASKFRYMAMDARRLEHWFGFAFWRLSWWYWLASGYGERVLRAAIVLIGVLLISAALYTQVGFVRWEPRLASEDDVTMTKRDEVGAPLKLSRALTYSAAVMTFQRPEPRPATTTAQTIVLLETILGPVQAALLALAIRRKFMR